MNTHMRGKSGFSLVELMIVITVVAILVALALPSYERFVRKSKRTDSQEIMMQFTGQAERTFTQFNTYDRAELVKPTGEFYTFTIAKSATGYTITATPKGDQSADGCGTMTLNQLGVKTHTGSEADCW